MKRFLVLIALMVIPAAVAPGSFAQEEMPPPRSAAELDQLLGPIALYPDPLIGELLPAAMQPAEIVQADRYLQAGGDPNQIDAQPWTSSVKAMAHYPDVLKWMDDNLTWTTAVGQAFLNQSEDVMSSIQRLRAQAQALGNLQTTPQQTVVVAPGAIEIVPANPEVIYVPVYEPEIVYFRRHTGPAPFITFGIGFSIGVWLHHDWDWHNHRVIAWDRGHERPHDWWYRPPAERFRGASPGFHVWQPNRAAIISRARREDRGFEVRHEPPRVITPPRPFQIERRPEPRREVEVRRPAETRPPEVRREEPRRVTPAPPPVQEFPRRPAVSNGALVGGHSAPDTRASSNRGQQSRQSMNPPSQDGKHGRR